MDTAYSSSTTPLYVRYRRAQPMIKQRNKHHQQQQQPTTLRHM
jgi:hypothetical protein